MKKRRLFVLCFRNNMYICRQKNTKKVVNYHFSRWYNQL